MRLPFDVGSDDLQKFKIDIMTINRTPGVCGGVACIADTRIPVWLLEQIRRLGVREADILRDYSTLTTQVLLNAWAYARSHRAEIDAQIEANES